MFLWVSSAGAYETDQVTDRAIPLEDVIDAANAEMNEVLAHAVDRANQETRCETDLASTREVLAREIYRLTSRDTRIEDREGLQAFGYGAYSAWLETAPIDRRTFTNHFDIYSSVEADESFILAAAGVCSTVNLAGVLMGTDKLDHFLGEGYAYAVRSEWGRHPQRAIRWGTATELTFFGLMTSAAFSFADLRANWDGYRFYTELLEPDSSFQLDGDGCVELARPFDWAEWVDPEYDEALNPPVYTRRVDAEVRSHLLAHRANYCTGYETWGNAFTERVLAALASIPPYASRAAPARTDPFQLDALCADRKAVPHLGPAALSTDDGPSG